MFQMRITVYPCRSEISDASTLAISSLGSDDSLRDLTIYDSLNYRVISGAPSPYVHTLAAQLRLVI